MIDFEEQKTVRKMCPEYPIIVHLPQRFHHYKSFSKQWF